MKNLVKISVFSVLCVLVWAFISCEVGLGDSVDVNPPTLVIDYPPVASVVRDEFILSGTCEDDGEVASVQVSVIDGNNVPVGEPRKAEIKDGRWTAALNKNNGSSWELPDGKYTFSVVAEDGAGRKSDKLERTLEIDNTAPVFIVKNPGTIKKDSPASYGSAFKVIGLMAEDHEVSKMIVKVYDGDSEVAEWEEEAVETAGGTEVTFASYTKDAEAENELNNRYLSIYDEETGGDQNFSCTITVMDSAKKYRTPESGGPSDDNGNTSDAHFLYDDVYTDLMGKTSDYGLTVSEIKQILNGTYSQGTAAASDEGDASRAAAPIDDAKVKEVLEKLEKYLTDTSQNEKRLQFKLNKDANPTWEIMGYATSVSGDSINFSDNTGSKGGKITFKASYGLDETYFYPNTLKVYLFGPYDPNNPKDAVNKVKKVEIYDDPDKYYTNAIENAKKIYTGSNEELLAAEAKAWLLFDGSTNEAYKDAPSASETSISLVLPTITANRQYLFAASGRDMDDLDFRPSADCYAFIGVASGTPPTITVTSPSKNSTPVKKDGSLEISGTANGRGSTIEKIWYETTVYDEGSGNKEVGTVSGTVETLNGKDDGSWSFNIRTGTQKPNEEGGYTSCLPDDNVMYKYSTVVYIQNAAGLESQDNVDVRIDSKNPEPRITSVTPIAQAAREADSLEVVNGTITISASVADANIKKSVLTISNSTDTSVTADKEEQTFFEHTFDTTLFTDKTDLTITLTSTDSAGNTASVSKKVHISQETDRPTVASETSHTLSSDDIAPNKNLFGVTSNNIFKATVTDDDGIGYLQLDVKKAPGGEAVSGYPKDLSADAAGKTSYSLSDKLPEQEGKYTVEITVRDNQYADGLTDTVKKIRSNSYTYNIGIDAANPTLEFTTTNRANTAANKDKQVLGVAKDTSGIKSIKGYDVKDNTDVGETGDLVHSWEKDGTNNTITVTNESGTTGYTSVTWEDTIASSILAKGSNRRRYIVEDIYSNTTTLDFIYYVDTVPPEILKVEGISAGGIINGGQIFLVKGTVSDEDNNHNPQEISSVRWKVSKVGESISVSDDKYVGADSWEVCSIGAAMNNDNSWNWSAAINLADNTYPDGKYVLYLAAFDAAGNQSKAVATAADNKSATQIAFANDKTPPSFGDITKTETADPSNTTTGSSISAKGEVTISGTVTESNLEKLEVKQVSSGVTTPEQITPDAAGSWTHTISAPGNYSVSFTATDKAGSSTSTGSCTIEIDSVEPRVKLDPTNKGFTDTDFAGGNKYLNSKEFALRVLVNDTGTDGTGYSSGIKSVKAVVDGKDTELSTTGALRGEDGSSDATTKNWTLYTGTIENLSESSHTVKISVTDTVGNTAESPEYMFTVDLTAPTLAIDEYASPSNAASVVSGAVSDDAFQRLMVVVTQNIHRSSKEGEKTNKGEYHVSPITDGKWEYKGFLPESTAKREMSTTLVFTAYDQAGNTTQKTANLIFDNYEPTIKIPDNFKSIGWSGSDTVSLRVLVTSDAVDLSGIASVTASYTDANGAEQSVSLSTNNNPVDEDGKNSTSGEYCIWSGSLANFKDGITKFKIKAADKAGNAVEKEVFCKVDTVNPEITAATATPSSVNKTLLDSPGFSLKVSITAVDKPKIENDTNADVSGIMSYSIKKSSDIVVPETPLLDSDGNYAASATIDATIPREWITNGTNLYSVYVKDAAGRESAAYTLNVSADIKAPVVKIVSPKVGSTVNKKITISGTIEDDGIINVSKNTSENGVTYAPPKLEVSTNGTSWTNVPVSGYDENDKKTNISWSGTFDTTTTGFYGDSNPSGELYVRMTAYDEAGNKSEPAVTEITVDQDTDRPVLRFTAMNDFTGQWSTSTGVVAGSIVDDDKADGTVVKGLWYIDSSSFETGSVPSVGDNNGWTNVYVDDAGNWEITIGGNEAQGVRTWHFYVIDNEDGTFCNTLQTTNALHCPYFQYRTNENDRKNYEAGITFTVDTKAPTADIAVARGADNTTPPVDSADSTVWQTTDGAKFGPNQGGYLWIRVTVDENVGMPEWTAAEKPVVLSIGSEDAGSTYVTMNNRVDSENPPKATYIYYFAKELSSLTTGGTLSVSAEVQDNSKLNAKAERRIIIDTDAPTVSIISPAASIADKVLGAVTIRGVATDTNFVSTVSKLEWAIPEKNTADDAAQTWTEISNIPASGNYELAFTNSATSKEGILYYVQDTQTAVYDVKEVTKIEDWTEEKISGCFKVPVWFRATDAVGNVGYVKDTFIVVDRDGGKPLVSINTPEENAIVSGTVTIYGTATDDISVKDVRLQIDANNDGTFDSTDYDLLAQNPDIYPPLNGEKSVSGEIKGTEQNAWYLLADGTNSWKLTIPTNKIAPGGNGTLRVRAMAFDYDGNTRGWSAVRIATIDANAPQIKNLRVVQYGLNVDAKHGQTYMPVSERAYEAGMYISDASVTTNGQWYLTADVTDNESVKEILFDKLTSSTNSGIDLKLRNITDIAAGTDLYTLNIPLITKDSGQIYYKITANDNSSGTTTQVITINIDSTAPSLYGTDNTRKNDSSALDNALRLRPNGSTEDSIGASNIITNSNLLFTLGDNVVEDGSGLHSVAFWFERKKANGTTSYLYDPMQKSGTSDSIQIEAKASGKVYLNADGLPALYFIGEPRESENSLTLPSGVDMTHIRPRGMIKIAGTYCTIDKTGVDSNSRTITFTPPISTAFTDGELILAQVVDYMGTEANKDGKEDNGDGDGMIETIRMAGSTYAWTASFDSANIPDGPVIVHVTAMDKAGNVTTGSIATQVSNNRPRIAKVLIGTDLNNNGTFDYNSAMPLHTADGKKAPATSGKAFGEFSYYSALGENNEAQADVMLKSDDGKSFKVRDGLIIVPEFVGGNGSELKYAWKDSAQADPTKAADSAGSFSALTEKTAAAAKCRNLGTSDIEDEIGGFGAIVLTGSTNGILGLSGEKTLSITFWDETEETTQGTDSQWALLNIPLEFSTTDTTDPSAKIKPFYWKSVDASGTTVIESSVPKDKERGVLLGHIELPDDLPDTFSASGIGDKDLDPKVSGKIKLEGTVYDDWLLGGVSVSFGSLISDEQLASYDAGKWTVTTPLPRGVASFDITDAGVSQDGHTADWTLVLDTEQISGSAKADVPFSIVATDKKGGNKNVPGTVSTTDAAETDYYRMDVVPYVTQVWTSLSEYERTYASMNNRASTGEYPVRTGETVTLYGWNLDGTTKVVSLGTETISGITVVSNTETDVIQLGTKGLRFAVPNKASGSISVTVNDIEALNNRNNDDAHGSATEVSVGDDTAKATANYANYYNRLPNGQNNNILTDDIQFDVWNFKTVVTPEGDSAEYVHMKVGPYLSGNSKSGRIGFSFKNGVGYFNMPGYAYQEAGVSTGTVDLYISKVLTYTALRLWDNGGSTYYYSGSDENHSPKALAGLEEVTDLGKQYYKISFTGNFSGSRKVGVILSTVPGTYTGKTADIFITAPGKYYIDSSLSTIFSTGGTLTPSQTYNSSGDSVLYSHTRLGTAYQGFTYNAFAFDKNGETYGAALNSDTSGSDGMGGNLQFFSRAESKPWGDYRDLNSNYYNNTNARRIENIFAYKNGVLKSDQKRTQSLSMATYTDTSKTYVYNAYYDHLLGQITFRVGSVTGTGSSNANSIGLGLQDLLGLTGYWGNGETESDAAKIGYKGNTVRTSTDSTYTGNVSGEPAYKYVSKIDSIKGTEGYVAVGVLQNGSNAGRAVIAWYDGGTKSLKLTSATLAEIKNGTLNGKTWSEKTVSANGGQYVQMAIDANDGIHLAYMSTRGADLYYAYLPSVDGMVTEVLVDSKNDVGDNCCIDVGRTDASSPWVPVITYKSNEGTKTKIAYPVVFNDSGRPLAGATSGGFFTGNWAVSMLPAEKLSISDQINVGLNKEWSTGVIHEFTAGTDDTSHANTGPYAICNSAIIYGNGTKNPVVGYAVSDGTIEMAQKK